MSTEWETVKLAAVTKRRREPVEIIEGRNERLLGIRWKNLGAYERGQTNSTPTKAKTMFRMRKSDFVFNRIDTDKGAFCVVDEAMDGAVASNEFPAYVCHTDRLLPEYLWIHFQQQQVLSSLRPAGSEGRARWKESDFERYLLRLPEVEEQKRVVDLISALDDAIRASNEEACALAELRRNIADIEWQCATDTVPLGSLGRTLTGGTPSSSNADFWTPQQVPFITASDMDKNGAPIISASRFLSAAGATHQNRTVSRDSVLQVCIGASVGKVGVTTSEATFNQQINAVTGLSGVDAAYLALQLSSSQGQNTIVAAAGKSTMPIISKGKWSVLEIPWPAPGRRATVVTVTDQIAVTVEALQSKISSLTALRAELLVSLLSGTHRIPETYDELMGA